MPQEQKAPADESFPQMEERVLKFWESADIFNKTLQKDAPQGDYVFYDGPPFATGSPHYGHIVGSIMKDVVPRYQTMRGYHVDRKWGWDCHGLPIENIVEKELGTKTKKEIEALGVGKFNDLCRKSVLTYVDEWQKVIRRLGRWADMENSYKTMDLNFMDSIWWSFKQLWDKGLIYKDYRSMHICPRCETTLSQSEVSEGYRDIKDLSATVKFKLVAGQKIGDFITDDNTYILAWTTTPWTLVGNVALAVGKEIEYVLVPGFLLNAGIKKITGGEDLAPVEGQSESYILAKERVNEVFKDKEPKISSEFRGSNLIGKSYKSLFSYYSDDESLKNHANGWKIYAGDFVTTTDGTGVVHIAPAFGEDDMNLGKANNLPFIQHVGLDGLIKKEAKDFAGKNISLRAKNKPEEIREIDLEIVKFLGAKIFKSEKYAHSYPHCWRCDTPLINYATSSWFVGVTKIKEQLLASAKHINWSPDYLKEGRFGNWLEGARDWSISRQRFWASAIPIWECACGERQVIGGVAELEKLTSQKITDIHKDKVDPLTFKCQKCGGEMKRVPDVLDCWFESGSMPFAQLHYPMENKEKFDNNFPAQFIAEGIDQTRCWFYYLHVIAGGIFDCHSFQNVIANGIVLAEDGKKMSKRLKNYPDPLLVMEKYGSDALRAYLVSAPVMQAENLNFSEKGVQESLRKNVMVLWNVYKFYEMFAADTKEKTKASESQKVLDQWILAKLNLLIKEITISLEAYNLPKALRPITEFIDELSTWYLRRSRDRFKSDDEGDKRAALATTKYILTQLAKLLAPFMPFMAENLWQKVSGHDFQDESQSVHLENWPEIGGLSAEQDKALTQMEIVRRIAELGLAKRDEAGIKIRQMLAKITVKGVEKLAPEYRELITDELNIRTVEFIDGGAENMEVELDINITPELKLEGIKREIIRFVNLLRKDAGLNLQDKAAIYVAGMDKALANDIKKLSADILSDTLSSSLEIVSEIEAPFIKEIKVDGAKLELGIKKIS
ncbi:MAG: isoleucine--tRNA ligase [Patescibacteria group bacterium]